MADQLHRRPVHTAVLVRPVRVVLVVAEPGGREHRHAADAVATGAGAVQDDLVADAGGVGEVEVGWHLHPDSWGRGYATEAARAVIERGFRAGLPEVYAVVRPGNTASVAVCTRLGMTPLGRMRRWYDVELDAFRLIAPAVVD